MAISDDQIYRITDIPLASHIWQKLDPERREQWLTRLQQELQEREQAFVDAEAALARAEQAAMNADSQAAFAAAKQQELIDAKQQELLAAEQARSEEMHTKLTLQQQLQETSRRLSEELQQTHQQTIEQELALNKLRAEASRCTSVTEQALALFTVAREQLRAYDNEAEQLRGNYEQELAQWELQAQQLLENAINRANVLAIELQAAEQAADIVRQLTEETDGELQRAADDTAEKERDYHQTIAESKNLLRQYQEQHQADIEAARQKTRAAYEQLTLAQHQAGKNMSLLTLAKKTHQAGTEKLAALREEEKTMAAAFERETDLLAQQVEDTLKASMQEHENYTRLLSTAKQLRKKADNAAQTHQQALQLLELLTAEERELRNAAHTASRLAGDAGQDESGDSVEPSPLLDQIGELLHDTVRNSSQLAEKKLAELNAAKQKAAALSIEAERQQRAAEQALDLAQKAEAAYDQAERQMIAVSEQTEQRYAEAKQRAAEQLQKKRAEIEAAAADLQQLTQNMPQVEQAYEQAKRQLTEVEQTHLAAKEEEQSLLSDYHGELDTLRERRNALDNDRLSALINSRNKRQRLEQALIEKQRQLELALREIDIRREQKTLADLHLRFVQTDNEEKKQAIKAANDSLLAEKQASAAKAARVAAARQGDYDAALLASTRAARLVVEARDKFIEQQEAEAKLRQDVHRLRLNMDRDYAEQMHKAALNTVEREQRAAGYDNAISLGAHQLKLAQKTAAAKRAGVEGAQLCYQRLSCELAELRKLDGEATAAEQLRWHTEEENAHIAAIKERAAAANAATVARIIAEQQAAAAAAAAQRAAEAEAKAAAREQARLAEQQAAEEKQLFRLAAGEILSPEENIALISSGEFAVRIRQLHEIAQNESSRRELRWIDSERAEQMIAQAKEQSSKAAEKKALFDTAHQGIITLNEKLRACEDGYQHAVEQLTAAREQVIAAGDTAAVIEEMLAQAERETQRADDCARPRLTAIRDSLRQQVLDSANYIAAKTAEAAEAGRNSAQFAVQINQLRAELKSSSLLGAELLGDWIFHENVFAKTHADVETVKKESASRRKIAHDAAQRMREAKQAAAAANAGISSESADGEAKSKKYRPQNVWRKKN
ncbi:MAG: hypothetical protein Q4B96_07485 [Bacillota bacterium]|nr:hypothetical protein [Bacillota bacterium]